MSKSISADAVYSASDEAVAALPHGSIAARMSRRASFLAAKTNDTPEYAGATADLRTLKPLKEGKPGYVVGGSPDGRTGKAYPSQMVEPGGTDRPRVNRGDILHARRDMLPAADAARSSTASIGTWLEGPSTYKDGVAVDLGDIYRDRRVAAKRTVERNEDASWDNGKGEPISYQEAADETGTKGPRPSKGAGQTVVMRDRGGSRARYAP